MKKNKILFVLGSFFPSQSGGPDNTIYWASRDLSKRNFDVTVISLKKINDLSGLKKKNLKLNYENTLGSIKSWYFPYIFSNYFSIGMFIWLCRNLKNYEFIVLTSIFYPMTWFSAILCILYKKKFSISPRGELEPNAIKINYFKKRFIFYLFLKKIFNRAQFILVTSKQELIYSRTYFNKMKYEIIPNFIDLNEINFSKPDILKKRDILFLGRIHPKKGIENLIKAYFKLPDFIRKDHNLLIVGSGNKNYTKSLVKLSQTGPNLGKIKFLGHKSGNAKSKIYKKSKIMVLPSYSENFGNVVLESLCECTPVIASKFTPWKELKLFNCGDWVKNDPISIAKSLILIFTLNSNEYHNMSISSRRFVKDKYDINKFGFIYKRVLEKYI